MNTKDSYAEKRARLMHLMDTRSLSPEIDTLIDYFRNTERPPEFQGKSDTDHGSDSHDLWLNELSYDEERP